MGIAILGGQTTPESRIQNIVSEKLNNHSDFSYNFVIPKYTENVMIPADTKRTVTIYFSRQERVPKKIRLFTEGLCSDYLNTYSHNIFIIDIIKIANDIFSIETFGEYYNKSGSGVSRILLPKVIQNNNANPTDAVIGFARTVRENHAYCTRAFFSNDSEEEFGNRKGEVCNFRYGDDRVMFDVYAHNQDVATVIELEGLIYL